MKRHFLVWLFLLTLAPSALAHDVGLQCKQQKNTNKVTVEVFFDDDSPAASAKVEVLDGAKMVVAAGKTDAKGLWSFAAPKPGDFLVVVDAGGGHRTDKKITVRPWNDETADFTDETSVTIQEGPSREELTRFPWLKVGIGLGAICLFSVAFLVARRKSAGS
jgi:nickel transport protein